jgi:hypothetical protein
MKYYRILSQTPYCGEERYDDIATENDNELHDYAYECCMENGLEWYDEEEVDMDEAEYFDTCRYDIEEIDYETFKEEAEPWQ